MDISAEALATALEELIAFLRRNDDVHWADVIDVDLRWLREGCHHLAGRYLSNFEGTGSLTYLRICPQNGHAVDESSVIEANRELDFLKAKACTLARDMARNETGI